MRLASALTNFLASISVSCSIGVQQPKAPTPTPSPSPQQTASSYEVRPSMLAGGVIRVIGRDPAACVTPVSPHYALTCAHVVDRAPRIREVPLTWLRWDGGELQPVKTFAAADLALVFSEVPFAGWYQFAEMPPLPGDNVAFRGWDWRDKRHAYADRYFEAKVVHVLSGHVMYSPGGTPGSSGSGVIDQAGRLVAINCSRRLMDNGDLVGEGPAVYGRWKPEIPVHVIDYQAIADEIRNRSKQ